MFFSCICVSMFRGNRKCEGTVQWAFEGNSHGHGHTARRMCAAHRGVIVAVHAQCHTSIADLFEQRKKEIQASELEKTLRIVLWLVLVFTVSVGGLLSLPMRCSLLLAPTCFRWGYSNKKTVAELSLKKWIFWPSKRTRVFFLFNMKTLGTTYGACVHHERACELLQKVRCAGNAW